jgi:hypothetical protein|tara:strand:- start:1866 stop:2573 length:708 start_codon:yes stop_codon:yes gene_type:complete
MSTKKNPYTKNISNADAQIKFGHITADNEIEAALIRSGYFYDHYISFGATGDSHRKGGTICKSPGAFQVKAGTKVQGSDNGVFIKAENGNIHISAPSGNLILDARNILIKATGDDTESGNVTMEGNNKIAIKGKGDGVDISGNSSVKIASDKQVDVIGKTILNLYGNVLDCADGSSSGVTGLPGDRAGSKTGVPKGVGGSAVSSAIQAAMSGLGALTGQNNEFNNSLAGSLTSAF